MTPLERFLAGELSEAIAEQSAMVQRLPTPDARLLLVEMMLVAGQFRTAWHTLQQIDTPEPPWPHTRRWYRRLIRAAAAYERGTRPAFLAEPPLHAKCRLRLFRRQQSRNAARWLDRADQASPHILGHVDGREFEGLRDVDDRFASVFVVILGRSVVWVPWEHLRCVQLSPAEQLLHLAYRPARLRLVDGDELSAMVPLIYPGSPIEFRLGHDTDQISPDHAIIHAVGGRILMIGDEELRLAEVHQLDIRGWV